MSSLESVKNEKAGGFCVSGLGNGLSVINREFKRLFNVYFYLNVN